MPRIFRMDLTFHPSNEHEDNHNHNHVPNHNRNDRHPPRHRSQRKPSHSTTRSPEPQTDHERISNRNDRHRPSDRSHATHSSSTPPSPEPRPRPPHYPHKSSNSTSNSEDEHAPETALALREPRQAQTQEATRDQAQTQFPNPPQPNIRRGTVHGPNPYGDGELRGEWMHVRSRNPDTDSRRGYGNADVEGDVGRRLGSGENENALSRPQERGLRQAHIPNDALSRRQDMTHDIGTPHRRSTNLPSTNPFPSSSSFSTSSAIFTEHILISTTNPKPGQQQRKRSGKVAASFSRRGEGGGVRGVW